MGEYDDPDVLTDHGLARYDADGHSCEYMPKSTEVVVEGAV